MWRQPRNSASLNLDAEPWLGTSQDRRASSCMPRVVVSKSGPLLLHSIHINRRGRCLEASQPRLRQFPKLSATSPKPAATAMSGAAKKMCATSATQTISPPASPDGGSSDLIDKLRRDRSGDLVFAVVGYAGSGTTFVAERLAGSFSKRQGFRIHPIKARTAIEQFAGRIGRLEEISRAVKISKTEVYQELGDELRRTSGEHGIVAAYMVREIKSLRNQDPKEEVRRVFILDSLKHPSEISLLRHVYGANFYLIGVGCRPDTRRRRLQRKYSINEGDDAGIAALDHFIGRDAEDSEHKYGQQVNNTFHLADFFVDNTASSDEAESFHLADELKKLDDLVFRSRLYRPSDDEKGMYYANAASLQSSCLSRQVGASILDELGNVVATGANEVPRSGGGSYSESDNGDDHRCFKRGFCANTKMQNKIINEVFEKLRADNILSKESTLDQVSESLRKSRVKSLIEFSRAVHAEMGALMSLVRTGVKLTTGSTLYSTTYPCHSCARHIVAAGIHRVVYLEPYAKSLAIDLHDDSIADNVPPKDVAGRVIFQPYQGVSPRIYGEIFIKRGDLKDSSTGEFKYIPEEHIKKSERALWSKTYVDFESDVERYIQAMEE